MKYIKIIIIGIVIISAISATAWYFYVRAIDTVPFISAYQTYDKKWSENKLIVYSPGAKNNAARQKLSLVLSQVLNEKISEKERYALSVSGQDPLTEVHNEIDVMKAHREDLEKDTTILRERAEKVKGIRINKKVDELVAFSDKRISTIREIEAVSYRMNDTIKEIFQGVAADHGALTQDRIRFLNDAVPIAEKDFDRLNALYNTLNDDDRAMKRTYASFLRLAGQ
jgi:hypothetical protein